MASYGRALEVAPDSVEALSQRAAEHMAVGAMASARADFERAARLDPAYPPLRLASATYRWLLGADPPPAFALDDLGPDPRELDLDAAGILLERLGRHLRALEFFERARDLDRARLTSLHGVGLCSFYLGRHREAREHYDVIRALLPHEVAPRLRLLQIIYQQAREVPSRRWRAALAADARDLLVAFDRSEEGSALTRLAVAAVMVIGGIEDAETRARVLETLEASRAAWEGDARARTSLPEGIFLELLAQVLIAVDPAAAERTATRSLILRPVNRFAPLTLGELAESRGERDLALGHYRRAWRKMPDSPLAISPLLRLAAGGASLGSEEHLELARRAIMSRPDDPVPLVRAALHLQASGHRDEARRAAEMADRRLVELEEPAELAWCREALTQLLPAPALR
jgi:tetratricopeptide (TPR) repeat protein